jgi:hypothetical protein
MALPTISSRPSKAIGSFTSKWNAAHNPIVYKIENDKWPTNSLDTPDSITAHADDNGDVQFEIAGHSYTTLQWVTIEGSDIASYNGVWQIIDSDANNITLDLPYEAGTLGSPTAVRYYQNYHNLIQIYVGIPAAHALNADDPIAFVTTIRSIPALDNIALVDVSEIVREKIYMLNEPDDNDINLWTAFYIYYAESYDDVSGGEIIQSISEYTSDAVNVFYGTQAKLPFQSPYGGNIGDYVVAGNNIGAFLTKFEEAVLWLDLYFDLSVILDSTEATTATLDYEEYDEEGNLLDTTQIALANEDEGVYRVRLDNRTFNANTAYIIAFINASVDSEELRIDIDRECSRQNVYLTWLNNLGGFDYWNFKAQSDHGAEFGSVEQYEKNIFENWDTDFVNGETVESFNKVEAWNNIHVRSQLLTREQIDGIANIKYSPFVQEIDADGNKRTVLIDKDDFVIREDSRRLYSIEFNLRYTDKIPVQNA